MKHWPCQGHQGHQDQRWTPKGVIGRKVTEKEVESDMKHWPFKVKAIETYIEVGHRGEA